MSSPHDVLADLKKVFPTAKVTMASDPSLAVQRWPTGVLPIDLLMDGGIPRGRWIEVYGSYSTLKSYYAYCALGAVQRAGGTVALIDTEHAWDEDWGRSLGIDPKRLLIARPETAEEAIGVLEVLIRDKFDLFVFDSIAAAIPRQHQESKPGEDTQPGALARVMSKGLARLTAANDHTAGIFINQTREKIGVTFGSPVTTSGGKAMGFYATYRLSFVRIGKVSESYKQWDGEAYKDAKRVVAHKIAATMEKSKLSAPHEDAWFLYDLRTGRVDETNFLVAKCLERGLLMRDTSGRYWWPEHVPDGTVIQPRDLLPGSIHGRDKFFAWLKEHQAVVQWMRETIAPSPVVASPGATPPAKSKAAARKPKSSK